MIERISLKTPVSSGYKLLPVKWDWETRSVEIKVSNGNEYRLEDPV